MRTTRALSTFAACAAVAFAAASCSGKAAGSETTGRNLNPAIGRNVSFYSEAKRRAVRFEGKDLQGTTIRSADLRGSVTLVNFWASWCGPCRQEQPVLEKVWREYRDRGATVRFVGINFRDSLTAANAFVEEFGVTYPSIFNPDASLAARFRMTYPPSTFVLDPEGRIAARIIGITVSPAELRAVIDQVLGT